MVDIEKTTMTLFNVVLLINSNVAKGNHLFYEGSRYRIEGTCSLIQGGRRGTILDRLLTPVLIDTACAESRPNLKDSS